MSNPNRLIVEGKDDFYAIQALMQWHTNWPNERPDPVFIKPEGGVSRILARKVFSAEIKDESVRRIGMVIDCDGQAVAVYDSIRSQISPSIGNLPHRLPPEGLILDAKDDKRVGLWLMPNNQDIGDLEAFLQRLVVDELSLNYARQCVQTAREQFQCRYRDVHIRKAEIYTWLAWQDPPGHPFGQAIKAKMLRHDSPHGEPFVRWFLNLFQLERKTLPA